MRSWLGFPYQVGFLPVARNRKCIEKEVMDPLPFTTGAKTDKWSWSKPNIEKKPSIKKISNLWSKIKKYTRKWKDTYPMWKDLIQCSRTRWINIVKMTILRKAIYRVNDGTIKRPTRVFIETEKVKIRKDSLEPNNPDKTNNAMHGRGCCVRGCNFRIQDKF